MVISVIIFSLLFVGTTLVTSKQVSIPTGWITHKNPYGFVVSHPRGWVVSTSSSGLILIQSKEKNLAVVINPFFLSKPSNAESCIKEVPKLFSSLFPDAKILKTQKINSKTDEVFAVMTFNKNGKAGKANVLCSVSIVSGMFYIISAPKDVFSKYKSTMVKVLNSFYFTQPTKTAVESTSSASLKYIKWQDPRENAFSVEVPKSWKVTGGLFRFAPADTRPAVSVTSPDNHIRVTIGDSDIPTFTLPSQMLAMSGFVEGSWYSPGYGVNMLVKSYETGADFAREYVTNKVAKGASELNFTETKERPDVMQAINALLAKSPNMGVSIKTSAGDVAFSCKMNGKSMRGYYLAGTYLVETSYTGTWIVTHLLGYLAIIGREKEAQSVLSHMIKTYHPNPEWASMQQNVALNTSKIVSKTNEEISNMINDTYWNRQTVMDDTARKWSNMILGQTDVIDMNTGETWKVAAGHNYYWRQAGSDTIVGTNTYDMPDIDFTPLEEW